MKRKLNPVSPRPPDLARKPSRFDGLLIPAAYLGLAVLTTWPYAVNPMTVSFLGQDSLLFLWNFWWAKFSLCDLHTWPFFCDYLYWPNGTSLALHSFALPYGIISIPFQLILGDLPGCIIATRVIVLASLAFSAWLMYRLARRLTGHGPAAFCAGVIFAFFPFRIVQMHLLHVFCLEFIVLWVLAFLWLLDKPTIRRALSLGGASALLVYASQEYALYVAVFALLYVVYGVVSAARRATLSRALDQICIAGAAAIIFSLPVLWPMLAGETGTASDFAQTAAEKSPALLAFFMPSILHPVWGDSLVRPYMSFGADGMRPEAGLGYAVLAAALIGLIAGPRRETRFWWIAGLIFFALILGPVVRLTGNTQWSVPTPYALLEAVFPPFRWMRDPLRMMPMLMMCLAVLAAFGMKWLAAGVRWRRALPGLFSALIVLEYLALPLPVGKWAVPEFYRKLGQDTGDYAILDITPNEKLRMYYQITHHKRLIGLSAQPIPRASEGALSFVKDHPSIGVLLNPVAFEQMPPELQRAAAQENCRLLREARVRYVIVYRAISALSGNHWEGLTISETPLPPEVMDACDRVIRLHVPVEVIREPELVAYRMW